MPFQKLEDEELKLIETNISLLSDLINPCQQNDWIEFFSGENPNSKLEWKGSLQEAYYLILTLRSSNHQRTFKKQQRVNNETYPSTP
jgi:hypothetical protein